MLKIRLFSVKLLFFITSIFINIFSLSSSAEAKPCQCYCSFKPGFRDKISSDRPRIFKVTQGSESYDVCFCKQRDINEFHQKRFKIKESDLNNQLTCCDKS